MIRVFPSKLDGDPIETHPSRRKETVLSMLERISGKAIDPSEPWPQSVSVNGEIAKNSEWNSFHVMPGDDVDIVYDAQGGVVDSISNIIGSVLNSVFSLFIHTPSTGGFGQESRGDTSSDPLDSITIKANQPKLNEVIPERFGLNRVYPDNLIPNYSYWEDVSDRESIQHTYVFLSLGVGECEVSPGQIHIGSTPIVALGDDVDYQIYRPGESFAGDDRTVYWYSSQEVGGTDTSNGLEIGQTSSVPQNPNDANAFTFAGQTVSVPSGAGHLPGGWESGMYARIVRTTPVEFVKVSGVSGFVGDINNVRYEVGDRLELRTAGLTGTATVREVILDVEGVPTYTLNGTNGEPISYLDEGTFNAAIGYDGMLYLITGVQDSDNPTWITVSMLDDENQEVTAWLGFDDRNTVNATVRLDPNSLTGGWCGPFSATQPGELANAFEVTLLFDQGLIQFDDEEPNKTYSRNITVEVSWRDQDALGEWETTQWTLYGHTKDAMAKTRRFGLAYEMRPQVRVRRLSAQSDDQFIRDGVVWNALYARIGGMPTRYDDISSIALHIKTGTRLSNQTENKIWTYQTRKLPPFDQPNAELRPTRAIADAVAYLCRKMGYTDDMLSIDDLRKYHQIWQQREDYFDHSFVEGTSLKDAINAALACGYAESYVDNNTIRVVRDEPRDGDMFDGQYNPQNIKGDVEIGVKLHSINADNEYDGVDVEYVDISTGDKETVEVRLPGDQGLKVQRVTATGINRRNWAWRYGMRIRRIQRYRRKSFSFTTGLDSLNSDYWDYTAVTDNYSTYGQSANVVSYEDAESGQIAITVDQPLEWQEGEQNIALLRKKDGTADGPYAASQGDDDYTLIINRPDWQLTTIYDQTDPTSLAFGIMGRAYYPTLIESVEPSGTMYQESEPDITVTAVGYAPEVYADYDTNAPES